MAMKQVFEWVVCPRCSGDGLAMVTDEEGNVTEGECSICGGLGYLKRNRYLEFDEDWFEERVKQAIQAHPEWFEARVVQAFTNNLDSLREAFKQWMREVLAE